MEMDVHQKSTEVNMHCEVIKWFVDESNPKCPFSIHRLAEIGLSYLCKPGEWYEPGTVTYIMQDAMECAKGVNSELNELVVYVAQDCTGMDTITSSSFLIVSFYSVIYWPGVRSVT